MGEVGTEVFSLRVSIPTDAKNSIDEILINFDLLNIESLTENFEVEIKDRFDVYPHTNWDFGQSFLLKKDMLAKCVEPSTDPSCFFRIILRAP